MHSLAEEQAPAFYQVSTVILGVIAPSLSVSSMAKLDNFPVTIEMMPQ